VTDSSVWSDDWKPGGDWSGGGARAKRLPGGDELEGDVYGSARGNWVPSSQTGERLWLIHDVEAPASG
jgi:hypothetical protein